MEEKYVTYSYRGEEYKCRKLYYPLAEEEVILAPNSLSSEIDEEGPNEESEKIENDILCFIRDFLINQPEDIIIRYLNQFYV